MGGLAALLSHCTYRRRSVIPRAASTAQAPLTWSRTDKRPDSGSLRNRRAPPRPQHGFPSPLLLKEPSSSQRVPGPRARSGSGEGDPWCPGCQGAREAGSRGSQRGLAQRHAEGSAAGGCVIISSLVTGSLSLPPCLIAACSLWQYSWYSQVPPRFRVGRDELSAPHQHAPATMPPPRPLDKGRWGRTCLPPFSRKPGTGRGQKRNLPHPAGLHTRPLANSWEGGTAKPPLPPSPARKGWCHEQRQTPVASAPPSPGRDTIPRCPGLAAGATVPAPSVRSHPPAAFSGGAP